MKYKCLILDHDDTIVNSTATIHYPCFIKYLRERLPHLADKYSLEEYLRYSFDPGVIEFFRDYIGLNDEEIAEEERYWEEYVVGYTPKAYPRVKEILERFVAGGGFIAVSSHSFSKYIIRDYKANDLPMPSAIYGWEIPKSMRKPSPLTVTEVMAKYGFEKSEVLVVDDLKPGYDMARGAGVAFAAAGWAYDIPEIEAFMRQNCDYYLKTLSDLESLIFAD